MKGFRLAVVAGVAAWLGACTLQDQAAPSLTGPSGFGQLLRVSATPDALPRDGVSQSVILVRYSDAENKPLGQRRMSLSASAGTLSATEVVTNNDGQATFAVTAPSPNAPMSSFSVTVTPVADNFANSVPRSVLIGLSGPGVPSADFTIAPAAPAVGQPITFDGSATKLDGVACGINCTYSWNFGDGSAEGMLVQHIFHTAGLHTVTLTATNTRGGTSNTKSKPVSFAADATTVTVTFSPAAPVAGAQVAFIAVPKLSAGVKVEKYVWNFGDGSAEETTTAPGVAHTFSAARTYVVTLTATDSLGRTATITVAVTVA